MAIVGITPGAVREFTSIQDRNDPAVTQVKWLLGEIDSLSMARLNDQFMDIGVSEAGGASVNSLRIFEWACEVCKYGLKGWKNFKDAAGNEIEFKTLEILVSGLKKNVAHPESLSRVPLEILQELAMEIKGVNTPTETEIKNSGKA